MAGMSFSLTFLGLGLADDGVALEPAAERAVLDAHQMRNRNARVARHRTWGFVPPAGAAGKFSVPSTCRGEAGKSLD